MEADMIVKKLEETKWHFAPGDPIAQEELTKRLVQTARKQSLIPYSDLVENVVFQLPNVNGGAAFQIQIHEWRELDRAIVGDFLGFLNFQSFTRDRIFLSALVVTKDNGSPGYGFINFMKEIGALRSNNDIEIVSFWAEEVSKVHKHYTGNE